VPSYIDISIPTGPTTTVYPGDNQPAIDWPGWSIAKGNPANVGFFRGGLHHGTHVDSPWHFIAEGKKIDELGIEPFVGTCRVIDAGDAPCISSDILEKANLPSHIRRVLFKTSNGATNYWHEPWNPNFVYIRRDAAEWCAARKMVLIGLDYLTIDPPSEPTFPAHLALLGNGIVILENICLRDIAPGDYELLAAPVRLEGADGAWTRAILRKD
jgi:arylformamidase